MSPRAAKFLIFGLGMLTEALFIAAGNLYAGRPAIGD